MEVGFLSLVAEQRRGWGWPLMQDRAGPRSPLPAQYCRCSGLITSLTCGSFLAVVSPLTFGLPLLQVPNDQ